MRTSLCLFVLAIGTLPLAAQPDRRMFPGRNFPPDISFPGCDQSRYPSSRLPATSAWISKTIARESCASRLPPGNPSPSHDDRAGVLVCVAGCRLRFTRPDGQGAGHRAQSRRDPLDAGRKARHAKHRERPTRVPLHRTQAPATVAPHFRKLTHELFSFLLCAYLCALCASALKRAASYGPSRMYHGTHADP